jgi:hypothetical protein
VTERGFRKADVFGIGPEDSSLKMALDETHIALALLARTKTIIVGLVDAESKD